MKKKEADKKEKAGPFIEAIKPGISGVPRIVEKILSPVITGVDIPTAEDIAKMGPKILGGTPAIGSLRRKRGMKVVRDSLPTIVDVYGKEEK